MTPAVTVRPDLSKGTHVEAGPSATNVLSGLTPKCFGLTIVAEHYPKSFKGPRGVKYYDPKMDPSTWIDNYA
jgi:hypothetical protein